MTYNYDIRYDGALVIETGTDGTEFTYDYRDTDSLNSASYKIGPDARSVSYQYDGNGNNTNVTLPNNASVANTYNSDDMVTSSKVTTTGNTELQTSYTYTANKENIASIANPADGTLTYTYDGNGNILTVSQAGVQKLKYTYDSLNQLIREDNTYSNQSYTYAYDVGGNITSKSVYAYTTGELGTATDTIAYTYGDAGWKDLLTAYNGNTITYDAIGNPLTYNGWTYTWQRGRQLASASKTGTNISYVYNDEGIRTSKTVNNVTTHYFLDNSNKVIGEQNVTDTIWYYYDANDKLIGFELNGTPYYYTRNVQGDITAIINTAGAVAARYSYDAWGNILSMTDGSGTDISSNTTAVGYINPYRYRGYRYDNETGMYYLQSRYYNPEIGRFINADIYVDTGNSVVSTNMFAYCENNPVNCIDPEGEDAIWVTASNAANGFGHASLLIQNASGSWYYFYWGAMNRSNLVKTMLTASYAELTYLGSVGWINKYTKSIVLKSLYNNTLIKRKSKYNSYIYIPGNFSAAITYFKNNLSNSKRPLYSLSSNNCAHMCCRLLERGSIASYRKSRIAIARKGFIVPNAIKYKISSIFGRRIYYSNY